MNRKSLVNSIVNFIENCSSIISNYIFDFCEREESNINRAKISILQTRQIEFEVSCFIYNIVDRLVFKVYGSAERTVIMSSISYELISSSKYEGLYSKFDLDDVLYDRQITYGKYKDKDEFIDKDGFGLFYDLSKQLSIIILGFHGHPLMWLILNYMVKITNGLFMFIFMIITDRTNEQGIQGFYNSLRKTNP